MSTAPLQIQQQQLILRLPDDLAPRVHRLVKEGQQSNKSRPAATIDVKPQDAQIPSDDFIFVLDEKEYPALLLNLPAPLESHKTFDNKIFLKSSDIGQMLQVFHTEKERDLARSKIVKTMYGDYTPSGITPPTNDIVKRRFELTRKNESYLPYKIMQVTEEINLGTDPLLTNPARTQYLRNIAESVDPEVGRDVAMESVVEEVVDFEEWMADEARPGHGISLTVVGSDWSTKDGQIMQQHPEILMFEVDQEEDAIEALATEQLRVERERAAAASAAATVATVVTEEGVTAAPTPLELVQAAGVVPGENAAEGAAVGALKLSLKKKTITASAGAGDVGESVVLSVGGVSGHLSPHSNTEDDLKIAAEEEDEVLPEAEGEEQQEDEEEEDEEGEQYEENEDDGDDLAERGGAGGEPRGASAAAVIHMMMEQEVEEEEDEEEEEEEEDLDENMLLSTVAAATTTTSSAAVTASVVEMEEEEEEVDDNEGEEQEEDEEGEGEEGEEEGGDADDDEEDWMKNI